MSHEDSKKGSNDYVEKFNEILHSLLEEYGRKQSTSKTLTEDQKNIARSLHELATSGELKLDRLAAETTSLCDAFISEWESSGIKSAAVQQLIALLNRPHIRGLLISAEDVASNKYIPKLPAIPFEVDEDEGIVVKVVRIVKRNETVGVTISGDRGKFYIARLIAGGVAARSACIQEGDRILELNGLPIAEFPIDDVVRILNRVDHVTVTLKLVPVDTETRRENSTSHVYMRAQYDYNGKRDDRHPCPDVSIAFSKGDILELLACNDDHWWQARRIGNGAFANCDDIKESSRIGLIPSEALQLAKATSKHEPKHVEGRYPSRSRGSHNSVEMRSTEHSPTASHLFDLVRFIKLKMVPRPKTMFHGIFHVALCYESVCRFTPRDDVSRIIVLLGTPGVGRAGETEGVDYYFVERSVMEKMICSGQMLEFGEYKGNLYGTALSSVRDAMRRGTLLITPHPLALQLLRTSEFMPFIVFIQPPPDKVAFKATRGAGTNSDRSSPSTLRRGGCGWSITDAEIEQISENSASLYEQYRHLLDSTLINNDLEESCTQLLSLINDLETKPTWVPLSWATYPQSD